MPYVDISGDAYGQWRTIREAIADVITLNIKPEVSGARVYSNWIYEIDPNTMLGKALPQMIATSGTSEGNVHCWTVGINEADFKKNASGEPDTFFGGGARIDWDLKIDVWGFRTFDGKKATQIAFENEVRLVGMAIARNRDVIRSEVGKVEYVSALRFPLIQPTPFADGHLYSVASGAMSATMIDTTN